MKYFAHRHAFLSLLLAAVMLFCVKAGAQDLIAVPDLKNQVTDTVGMLTTDQRATLESGLQEYARRTGSQIGILLMSTTAPEAIEQYGIRVADAWKLGRKGIDDGVILIVAKDNPPALRRLRLEVGRGVQGTLTDAQSNRILQDVIAPHFKRNDYYGGLVAASAALQTVMDREHLSAPASGATRGSQRDGGVAGLLPIFFIILVGITLIGSRRGRGRGRGTLSSNVWGTAAGVILGSQIGRGGFGGGGGFSGGGGFGGGGGGFDGGGASGNW
jgi:uncharacterized protein